MTIRFTVFTVKPKLTLAKRKNQWFRYHYVSRDRHAHWLRAVPPPQPRQSDQPLSLIDPDHLHYTQPPYSTCPFPYPSSTIYRSGLRLGETKFYAQAEIVDQHHSRPRDDSSVSLDNVPKKELHARPVRRGKIPLRWCVDGIRVVVRCFD